MTRFDLKLIEFVQHSFLIQMTFIHLQLLLFIWFMTNKFTAFNLKGAFFERRGEREGCWYKLRERTGKICPQMFPLMIAVCLH